MGLVSSCADTDPVEDGTATTNTDKNKMSSSASCTFTVFFEGTANRIDYNVTQIGLFAEITDAVDLRLYPDHKAPNNQYKCGFDGCGVTNGNMGVIFATGLEDQCKTVCMCIDRLHALYGSLTLNVVGLSRGGIAAIYLAQMCCRYPRDFLTANLLLFDPVPGNLISTSRVIDLIGVSTANSAMALHHCLNLGKILALYPYLPLPDLAFHAPVFPIYPDGVTVEEDAVLGCHQGALFCQKSRESFLSFARIKHWLLSCGTQLGENNLSVRLDKSLLECKLEMDKEMQSANEGAMIRHCHSYPSGAVIVRHEAGKALYLNKWHESLTSELEGKGSASRPPSLPASEEGATHLYLLEIKR